MKRRALKAAFPLTLPVMAGYLFLGFGFGILLESKGFSFIWALLMSVIIFAGSMQYVAIDLFTGGVSFITTAVITVMIQIRHLFYGLTLIDKYRDSGKKKPLLIFQLTDETYSLVASAKPPEDVDQHWFYLWISALDHCYWIIGCTSGALFGSMVHFNTKGIDFVMTALFVVIFIDQWLNAKEHIPAVTGVVCSILCVIIFGSDSFIIPAMILILLMLTFLRKTLEKRGASNEDT